MLRVAERFGVSSSYLARVFTELRVPRPAPGYWSQREFGKAPPKPDLPTARPGDQTDWSPGTAVGTAVRTVVKAIRAAKVRAIEKIDGQAQGTSPAPLEKSKGARMTPTPTRHELLIGVKPLFLKTRNIENDILRPYKRLLVDVMASAAKLDEVLDGAQALFEALNRRGFHVGFAPTGERMSRAEVELLEKPVARTYHRALWAPERPTVVYLGGTAVGLTLFEMTEEVEVVYVNGKYIPVRDLSEQQLRRYKGDHHWRSKEEHASGRVCLQAFCPFGGVKWSRRWQESKPGAFRGMVPGIVSELEALAPGLVKQVEEARLRAEEESRRWDEQQRQWRAESERLRREKNRQESRRDLMAAITFWDEARRVWDYFKSIEAELEKLPEEKAALLRERLRLGKELVGTLDPIGLLTAWKTPDER